MKKLIILIFVTFAILILYYKPFQERTEISSFEIDYIDSEIIKDLNSYVLLNFCSYSNSTCKRFESTLKSVFNEFNNTDKKVFNINIFDNQELLNDFPIPFIPAQFFFDKNGNNFMPKGELAKDFSCETKDEKTICYHLGMLSKEDILKIFEQMQEKL